MRLPHNVQHDEADAQTALTLEDTLLPAQFGRKSTDLIGVDEGVGKLRAAQRARQDRSLALIALFYFWQPLGGMIWEIDNRSGRLLLNAGFGFGWALVLYSTFLINHFDLFGLRQVWLQLLGKPYTNLPFKTPGAYKLVRHPLYLGWFFAFWCTPHMSATHLLFALVTSVYILVAILFEEHDLLKAHPQYHSYRQRVPMLLPRFKSKPAAAEAEEAA